MQMLGLSDRRNRSRRGGSRLLVLLLLCLAALGCSSAGAAEIEEFSLPLKDVYPGNVVVAGDGTAWVSVERHVGEMPFHGGPAFEGVVDRIGPLGEVTEFPSGRPALRGITLGSDGNIWFVSEHEVGYLTPGGQFTGVVQLQSEVSEAAITTGPDGNVWVAERRDSGTDAILRVSTSGEAARFFLPQHESGPADITSGPDGALWFTEYFGDRIGRITTSGEISEFPAPPRPTGITTGPEGNLWFIHEGGIARITPSGDVADFPVGFKSRLMGTELGRSITAGSDGRLWFPNGTGALARINPDGGIAKRVPLPQRLSHPQQVGSAPDGTVWFSATAGPPCEGGGETCQWYVPGQPGIVGRAVAEPLTAALIYRLALVRRGRTRIYLSCREGDATDICRGAIRLKLKLPAPTGARAHEVVVGRARYSLPVDMRRAFGMRLSPQARAVVARHRHLSARVTVTLEGGGAQTHTINLRED